MKQLIFALALLAPFTVHAAGGGPIVPNDKPNIDLTNQASLQRGANYFVSYCLNCHSLQYERWQRFEEFGITEDILRTTLLPASAKKGDLMTVAMRPIDGEAWFGAPPPDLTLETRLRGTHWVYNYMRAFYVDESRPFGVNNTVYDKVGMPHVLWELQGLQKAIFETVENSNGSTHEVFQGFEIVQPGKLTPAEYDAMVLDMVNFMAYIAEPTKLKSQRTGIFVLIFLGILFIFSYLLKKEYWKDIH
jgi:ubiquinol-cytochrome c reductase cytochrome c1 subunit